jgi:anti-anti-sigma factor
MRVFRERPAAGRAHLLRVEGELDAFTVHVLREEVDALLGELPIEVTLDLSALSSIDSSGVGAIVSLYRRLRERGRGLTICGLAGQPRWLFDSLKRSFQGGRGPAPSASP